MLGITTFTSLLRLIATYSIKKSIFSSFDAVLSLKYSFVLAAQLGSFNNKIGEKIRFIFIL